LSWDFYIELKALPGTAFLRACRSDIADFFTGSIRAEGSDRAWLNPRATASRYPRRLQTYASSLGHWERLRWAGGWCLGLSPCSSSHLQAYWDLRSARDI